MKTSLDTRDKSSRRSQQPTSDGAFALAAVASALTMLTLLAVLTLADVVGLTRILPFLAFPPALLAAAAFFLWRWATGEAEAAVAREISRPEHVRRSRP
jgi:hypothetical protein